MSDHNREIVVGEADGSTGGCSDNPWDGLLDQLNEGDRERDLYDDIFSDFQQQLEKRETYIKEELLAHLKVAKREIIRLGWQEDPVHIDPDDKALALLQKKGFRTEQMTIEDYIANMPDGEKIGMILSYNAGLVPDLALKRLQEGGIILANNWHGSADNLHNKRGLELIGAVVQDTEDFVTVQAAESLLGKVQYLDNGPNGYVNYDPTEEQLEQARAGAGIVFEEYRSPDSLWIFRKSSIKSE